MNMPFTFPGEKHFNLVLAFTILSALFFGFYNLSGSGVHEWDEARNAVNAMEMLKNHDWLNFYYCGKPDVWNAKPPLFIWLLCISFFIFGKTVFALHLIPVLAAMGCLLVIYKTTSLFIDRNRAILVCLILVTARGFLGTHTGRTGDFDSLNCLFLLLSVHFFLVHVIHKKKHALLWCAVFTGLSFMTKGFACFLFLPAFFFFLLFTKKLKSFFSDKRWITAAALFSVFPVAYFIAMLFFGNRLAVPEPLSNSTSSMETLLFYDIFGRVFGNATFNKKYAADAFFGFLDVHFAFWYVLFYLSIVLLALKKIRLLNPLVLFSFTSIATLALFYSLMHDQNYWYLMPLVPFLAIFISETVKLHKYFIAVFAVIFLISAVKQFDHINKRNETPGIILGNKEMISSAPEINCLGVSEQDEVCYVYMLNKHPRFYEKHTAKPGLWLINKKSPDSSAVPFLMIVAETEDYILAEI